MGWSEEVTHGSPLPAVYGVAMGRIIYWVACEECEPGILPHPFDTAEERTAWLGQHRSETGHEPRLVFERGEDEWD
jgi:hypothetical protein